MATTPDRQATRLADLPELLAKIERVRLVRRTKFYLRDEQITLNHGSGGKASHNLIEGIFAPAFANPLLDRVGVFITTSGVGVVRADSAISQAAAQPGDKILLSGPIGDHGIAIMLAREALELESELQSDTAALDKLVAGLLDAAGTGVHCLKDPTRGGIATALNEIAIASEVAIALDEQAIPVRPDVRGACELLGLDPLTITNEGKLLAVVAAEHANAALAALRSHPLGREAALVGEVRDQPVAMVFLRTDIGGTRVLDMLVGDPLPRIC